jgi:WD40 repeat protein
LLSEKGRLIIWSREPERFLIIDLDEGTEPYTVRGNADCEWQLLPGSTNVVCGVVTDQYYLLDVLDRSRQKIRVEDVELLGWSPNGQFLLFMEDKDEDRGKSVFSYDTTTHVTRTLATNITPHEQGNWLERPVLSANGDTLAVIRYTADGKSISAFELYQDGVRQLGLSNPPATWDIAWSPLSPRFVYGATDIEQEIGPHPNILFMVDVQTGEIRELAKAPAPSFFWPWSLEWSPNGRQVAAGLWDLSFRTKPQICIVDVDSLQQTCLPARRGLDGSFLAWSPSGEHITYVDIYEDLIVSRSDGTAAVKLLDNIGDDVILFWR